jgi:dethiobiotin synthetase
MHNWPDKVFIAGIGTGVGKTIVSAVLVKALQADYWKPVQSGDHENSDTIIVQSLVTDALSVYHPESYKFKTPASPHYAAKAEGITINLNQFTIPVTNNKLIIEAAGGLMVPLNEQHLNIDLIGYLNIPVVLVSGNYLGSINHTLMSIEVLRQRGLGITGIIFNGAGYLDNEEIITHFANVPVIGRVEQAEIADRAFISIQAEKMRLSISKLYSI